MKHSEAKSQFWMAFAFGGALGTLTAAVIAWILKWRGVW
jgi:hypothetical protein